MKNQSSNDKSVKFLYTTTAGKFLLSIMLKTKIPAFLGIFLRSPFSHFMIKQYIRKNGIDMSDFPGQKFLSFNDFFTRKKEITFDSAPGHFISPSDGFLSVFKIEDDSRFNVKGFDYSLKDFFETEKFGCSGIENKFNGGLCLIFRLAASNYHRYCYIDSGSQNENHFIKGSLYSVQPAACENFRVYTKNRRSWTILSTENFGEAAQIEVGAFSVGGIKNHLSNAGFSKGQEKGYFDLHGSTIVILLQKDKIQVKPEIMEYLSENEEYPVKAGQWIGIKA